MLHKIESDTPFYFVFLEFGNQDISQIRMDPAILLHS